MSLALDYSSDDAELTASVAKDAFGIASLSTNKKPRVDEAAESKPGTDAAPHVLAKVSDSFQNSAQVLKSTVGSS
jgi:pre-mRNA-processing factor 17